MAEPAGHDELGHAVVRRIAVTLALALVEIGALHAQCPDGTPPPCRSARPVPAASVAVLNFENRSRDSADAFLAEGLADEISTLLTKVGRLTVISRAQVRRLPGSGTMDIPAVGRALGSVSLVTGSVQGTATRLRVSVELLRANNAVQVWGSSYDRARTDLLDIQTDIATQVATAIAGTLRPGERATLARAPTRNPLALEHLMRGNILVVERSTDRISRAIEEYRAALRVDSSSAAAQGRLAFAYALCPVLNRRCLGLGRDTLLALAARTASLALSLDSSSSEAWMALGEVRFARRDDPAGTFQAYRRAVELDSGSADAWRLYGWVFSLTGQDSAASRAYRRALRIDPAHAITYELLARLRTAEGRLDEALGLLDSATLFAPQFPTPYGLRAHVLAYRGDTAGARSAMETLQRLEPGARPQTAIAGMMAFAYSATGDTLRARALTDSLLADSTAWGPSLWLALWRQRRVDDYWRVAQRPDGSLRGLPGWFPSRYPWFAPIRDDPRARLVIDEERRRWEHADR